VSTDSVPPDEANEEPRAALSARGIVVQRAGKRLLRGVDLTLSPGTVTGVLGPSGAGKSTLFRVLVGEDRDHDGQVLLDGADVTRKPLHARARLGLGYMPQGPSVLWDLSVEENVRTFLEIARGSADSPALRGILEATRLDEARATRAGLLSGGERRRLELARVLSGRPRVVVCDEPFAGVDPAQAAHLGDLLADLTADGVAVVLADHHVEEALRICTSASLLLDGAIVTSGTPEAFREHPVVRGRYLGTLSPSHAV